MFPNMRKLDHREKAEQSRAAAVYPAAALSAPQRRRELRCIIDPFSRWRRFGGNTCTPVSKKQGPLGLRPGQACPPGRFWTRGRNASGEVPPAPRRAGARSAGSISAAIYTALEKQKLCKTNFHANPSCFSGGKRVESYPPRRDGAYFSEKEGPPWACCVSLPATSPRA